MKRHFVCGFVLLCFLRSVALAQGGGPADEKFGDDAIAQKVSRLLLWTWYWDAEPLPGYLNGTRQEMAIVESPNELAIFLAEIGISFRVDSDGRIGPLRGFPPTTNSTAIDRYIAEYSIGELKQESENKGEITQRDFLRAAPESKDTVRPEEKRKAFKIRSKPFTLPKLIPPNAIRFRLKSPELPRLKVAILAALGDWYNPNCGPGRIIVPYFSEDDPWVDVYADLGRCGKGIIYFTHHDENGAWKSSPFWPDKPPDNFSNVIQKIRRNAADIVKLPFTSN